MVRLFTVIFILCMLAPTAFAGHVDTYGIGSKGTSMGGAMTAGTDDAFSIYYNPAAMSRIKKRTFAIGAHFVDPSLEIENFHAATTSAAGNEEMLGSGIKDSSPILKVPHFAYVHPLNDKVAIGVAFYVPYGLELSWDKNTDKNPAAYNTFHSYYVREVVTPTISYKATDKLSLGFGIALGKSKAGSEKIRYVPEYMKSVAVIQAQTPSLSAAQAAGIAAAYTELDGAQYKTEVEDDFNYSFNFGILYEFNEKWALGITFRSKSDTKMEGESDVTPDLSIWKNQVVDATVEIDSPNQLQVGVQYKPTPKWNLNFDITRTWWGSIEDYDVVYSPNFMQTPPISNGAEKEHYPRDWKDTFQYRFGAEYKMNETVDLRLGYYYDPTVVPNDTFDVQWPDSDKHVLSAGTGLHFGNVTVDLVVQYVKITDVDIKNGESELLNETFTRPGVHEGEVKASASGHLLGFGATFSYSF